ncbi:MAG TPA: acyltransferase [Rhizomicrobium sp.]|nr:acyltransferase [Rhizomicrobium sp.]
MTGTRFRGLDGLRGVAAVTVMLFHCDKYFHIFRHGYLAVDLFMILSGFVIALRYEEPLREGLTIESFLCRRAVRLLPTYWIGALLGIGLFWLSIGLGLNYTYYSPFMRWIGVPIATIFMIPLIWNKWGALYPALENVPWSLVAEWAANALYAEGLFRLSTRSLIVLTLSGWAVMSVVGYHTGAGWCVGMRTTDLMPFGFIRCIPSFIAGVVIYRVREHSLLRRLPVISTALLLMGWFGIAAIPATSGTATFDMLTVTVAIPALIVLLIRSEETAPAFCSDLGAISYPLYLVQAPIIAIGTVLPLTGASHGANPMGCIVAIAASIAAAWGLNRIVLQLSNLAKLVRNNAASRGRQARASL